MNEELKPCPFCGGKPEFYPIGNLSYRVRCTSCDASAVYSKVDVKYMNDDEKMAAVAAKWNRRAGDE